MVIYKTIQKRGPRLTERDLRILKLCHEQKYLTLDQIARVFFPKTRNKYKVPLRCLNRLMRRRYLRNLKQGIGKTTLYLVGQKGIDQLEARNSLDGLPYVKTVDWHSFERDVWATDIRLILEELGFQWTSGRRLKGVGIGRKILDGKAELKGHFFLIEIENNSNEEKRHQWIFRQRSRKHEHGQILYIVKDERTKAYRLKDAASYKRIYFITVDELHEGQGEARFMNSDDCELVLKDLVEPLKRRKLDPRFDLFRKVGH